jgi:hypothetical protein
MSTEFLDEKYREAAFACAKGSYQRALLSGHEAWSGATLRGTARVYASKYRISRNHLIERIEDADIPFCWRRELIGGRISLLVGVDEDPIEDWLKAYRIASRAGCKRTIMRWFLERIEDPEVIELRNAVLLLEDHKKAIREMTDAKWRLL